MAHDHEGFGPAYVSPDPEYAVTPPGAGYEHTDANIWVIVKFALWLVVSAAIIHVGVGFMFGLFVEQRELAGEAQYPLATGTDLRLPAQPRLQRFPANEAFDFRRQEAAALGGYGWVDRQAGTVQIPIDDAMRLVVERGLPFRQPAAAVPADQPPGAPGVSEAPVETPGLMPSDASSGRTMERRRQ
jgi:hypothetical protein